MASATTASSTSSASWASSTSSGFGSEEGDSPPPWEARPPEFWAREFGVASTACSRSTRRRVLAAMRDFAENAFMAGLPLVVRRGARPWDRCLWAALVATALVVGLRDAVLGLHRAPDHVPVAVSVHDTAMLVHSYPFPAVAICPKMRVRRRVALRYLKNANRLSFLNESAVLPALKFLQSFSVPSWSGFNTSDFSPFVSWLFEGVDLRDFMDKVFPSCESVFFKCSWSGRQIDCCDVFKRTMSGSGLCFIFNSLSSLEAGRICGPVAPREARGAEPDFSNWYHHRPQRNECVLARSAGAGIGTGLQVALRSSDPNDKLSDDSESSGFQVAVLAGNEVADTARGVYLREAADVVTLGRVSYSESTADLWLRGVAAEERQCLFEDEVPEVLAGVLGQLWYTHEACLLACRLRFLHHRCGCFPFITRGQDEQCTLQQYKCIITHSMLVQWVRTASASASEGWAGLGVDAVERNASLWPDCRACLPLCSHSAYETEFRDAAGSAFAASPRGADATAQLHVYHRDLHSAVKYIEHRDMAPVEKLLACTNTVTLLLGVSVMSVVQALLCAAEAAALAWRPLWARLARLRHRCWRPPTPPAPPAANPRPTSPGLPFVL